MKLATDIAEIERVFLPISEGDYSKHSFQILHSRLLANISIVFLVRN